MCIEKVSRKDLSFPSLPISNPKSLGFAIGIITATAAVLGLTIVSANRCYSTILSSPECPLEPSCECEIFIRFLQVIPFLILSVIALNIPANQRAAMLIA